MALKITLAKILATGLCSGLSPKAPGTVGSVAALLILFLITWIGGEISTSLLVVMSIIAYVIGHWCCATLADQWGHDPGKIVIDEWVGMWLALVMVPFTWQTAMMAFVFFRFFDISKPLGVGYIDKKISGPASVMLDDVLAGGYAALLTYVVYTFLLV